MQIDLLSFVYGLLVGVVPTVIAMSIAHMWDDMRNKSDEKDLREYLRKSNKWRRVR